VLDSHNLHFMNHAKVRFVFVCFLHNNSTRKDGNARLDSLCGVLPRRASDFQKMWFSYVGSL